MNNEESNQQEAEIEAYLRNQLAAEAREAFEARLQTDAALAEAVEAARMVHGLVTYDGRVAMKARLQAMHEAGPPKEQEAAQATTPVVPLWKRASFRAAAAIALLAMVALFWWLQAPSPNALYAEHYQPLEDRITTMAGASDETLARGMTYYNEGQYAKALQQLEAVALPDIHPDNALQALYIGICLLETGSYADAELQFMAVFDDGGPLYEGTARWYWSLALLKQGKLSDARLQLKLLADSEEPKYGNKANTLLQELGE